jgi:hypothetical protein
MTAVVRSPLLPLPQPPMILLRLDDLVRHHELRCIVRCVIADHVDSRAPPARRAARAAPGDDVGIAGSEMLARGILDRPLAIRPPRRPEPRNARPCG